MGVNESVTRAGEKERVNTLLKRHVRCLKSHAALGRKMQISKSCARSSFSSVPARKTSGYKFFAVWVCETSRSLR